MRKRERERERERGGGHLSDGGSWFVAGDAMPCVHAWVAIKPPRRIIPLWTDSCPVEIHQCYVYSTHIHTLKFIINVLITESLEKREILAECCTLTLDRGDVATNTSFRHGRARINEMEERAHRHQHCHHLHHPHHHLHGLRRLHCLQWATQRRNSYDVARCNWHFLMLKIWCQLTFDFQHHLSLSYWYR